MCPINVSTTSNVGSILLLFDDDDVFTVVEVVDTDDKVVTGVFDCEVSGLLIGETITIDEADDVDDVDYFDDVTN